MRFSSGSIAAAFAAVLSVTAAGSARADIVINIDKSSQSMSVVVDGWQRWHWPVSSGVRGRDTPSGTFKPFRMEKDHFSKEWDDAPMPNSIFFTMKGHAIHGSYDVKHLGQAASHGCVRLAPENAALLFSLVKKEGMANTRVILTGDARQPEPGARRGQQPDFFQSMFNQQNNDYVVPDDTQSRRRARRSSRWD